jgi:hypothetical protein
MRRDEKIIDGGEEPCKTEGCVRIYTSHASDDHLPIARITGAGVPCIAKRVAPPERREAPAKLFGKKRRRRESCQKVFNTITWVLHVCHLKSRPRLVLPARLLLCRKGSRRQSPVMPVIIFVISAMSILDNAAVETLGRLSLRVNLSLSICKSVVSEDSAWAND